MLAHEIFEMLFVRCAFLPEKIPMPKGLVSYISYTV